MLTSDSEEEFEQLTEYLAQCSSEKGKKVSIDNGKITSDHNRSFPFITK